MKHNERARVAPLYLTFTHPFRTQKTHERPPAAACGGLRRRPAAACGGGCGRRSPRYRSPRCRPPRCRSPLCLLAAACGRLALRGGGLRRRPAAASRVDGFIAIRSNLYSLLLRPRVRGFERPLLCLAAGTPHGNRKRPHRNAHLLGASSAHASNYRGSVRVSVHLDDFLDVTREAPACGRL